MFMFTGYGTGFNAFYPTSLISTAGMAFRSQTNDFDPATKVSQANLSNKVSQAKLCFGSYTSTSIVTLLTKSPPRSHIPIKGRGYSMTGTNT